MGPYSEQMKSAAQGFMQEPPRSIQRGQDTAPTGEIANQMEELEKNISHLEAVQSQLLSQLVPTVCAPWPEAVDKTRDTVYATQMANHLARMNERLTYAAQLTERLVRGIQL